jgi:hypothetical protein
MDGIMKDLSAGVRGKTMQRRPKKSKTPVRLFWEPELPIMIKGLDIF